MKIDFDVIYDDTLIKIFDSEKIPKHYLVSMLNDYEDGHWRLGKFLNFLWDNIGESALSYKEKNALIEEERYHELTVRAAKNLRLTDENDPGQGSEIAEVLLYAIMKHYFHAISVVPKIFYKQNVQDNAKGADSVHIVIDDEDFSLWLGEAKFYNGFDNSRFESVIDSIKNQLDPEKLRKENCIITNTSQLDDCISNKKLVQLIKKELSAEISIDSIKERLHIPILILHECDITKSYSEYSEKYRSEIKNYHLKQAQAYFNKQALKLAGIHHYQKILSI